MIGVSLLIKSVYLYKIAPEKFFSNDFVQKKFFLYLRHTNKVRLVRHVRHVRQSAAPDTHAKSERLPVLWGCYRSYLWLRVISPQTYDRGDNPALALPWVTGYRSYKSYKSYRHWLVMTLTSVASARRGWLMAPLPNLTLRLSQLEAAASYFGVDVRPRSVRSAFAGGLLRPLWLAVSVSGHFCHWSIQVGCVKTTITSADCQPARGYKKTPWR